MNLNEHELTTVAPKPANPKAEGYGYVSPWFDWNKATRQQYIDPLNLYPDHPTWGKDVNGRWVPRINAPYNPRG